MVLLATTNEKNFSSLVVAALIVVILAVVVLGIVIGYDLKPSSTSVSGTAKYADVSMVVQGDSTLGPDGLLHDAFAPCNFTVYAGQTVNLTIINYDNGQHSFTSTTLNVNFQVPASQTNGVPTVTTFQFTETQPGTYRWWCTDPCDTDAGGWAMTTGSDGQPDQIGFMGGFVTVLPQ